MKKKMSTRQILGYTLGVLSFIATWFAYVSLSVVFNVGNIGGILGMILCFSLAIGAYQWTYWVVYDKHNPNRYRNKSIIEKITEIDGTIYDKKEDDNQKQV